MILKQLFEQLKNYVSPSYNVSNGTTNGLHTKFKNKIIKDYEEYRWLFIRYWAKNNFVNTVARVYQKVVIDLTVVINMKKKSHVLLTTPVD